MINPTFIDRAEEAERRVRHLFEPTPCMRNDHLSAKFEADIWLKREDLTPVRSYKLRGAWNAMHEARETMPNIGLFVCASAGNHAQGMAYACREFGVRGVIFMPVTTPQQKIDKTRTFGGDMIEIRLVGDYFDDTLASAKTYCDAHDGHFLAPFDDQHVIEGQASVAVEFVRQMPKEPDIILLPVGGGGLSAGVVQYLRACWPDVEVYFVEPKGGASLKAALINGSPTKLSVIDSFVDGAAVARIGAIPFEALSEVSVDHVLTAPEDRICTTIVDMLNVEGIVLEPAGAMTIDALQDLRSLIKGRRVLCVTSGGNFDFERLPEVRERAQRFLGLKKYFIMRLPQRPGALREFLDMLGPQDDISRFEYLKKSARNFGSVLIGIETKDPKNFKTLFDKMNDVGLVHRDITDDEALSEFVL
ncbi:threonine ammonia-lyase IlvA [Celeribacter marinus]|uniref:L-threonine dehydratase n=1 Tax=Celeribacter marinus TaxID=1397108 RepID=A0A0N9ZQ26_9RHOB|nr:threonine ammonia-lyase IlvA [Celeribacter marinus]ALI55736.1 threonine dehydratase [Celeribacter marinus]SFL04701.1 L-threonine ammonia-lyase [Celeribacter marinus]